MLTYHLILSAILFISVQVLIQISNALTSPRIPEGGDLSLRPRVSILVPARNEEHNIRECVLSLLTQDYDNYEVLVLDDNSQDATGRILYELESEYSQLTVLNGRQLEKGWYGKHWACHQLAQQASGEWLLFTDADTTHSQSMLKSTIPLGQRSKADLLTAFVRQRMVTLGEKLTVPFPLWCVFSLLPIIVGIRLQIPAFSTANGQFMLFRRSSYERIGGHARVKNHATDDIALARLVLASGMQWRMYDATDLVSCRMYHSLAEAHRGFVKNYFAIFNYRILVSLFAWSWMFFLAWYPILLLAIDQTRPFLPDHWIALCYLAIGLQTLLWVVPVVRFRLPLIVIFLHPLITALAVYTGFISIIKTMSRTTSWKGRELEPPRISWI